VLKKLLFGSVTLISAAVAGLLLAPTARSSIDILDNTPVTVVGDGPGATHSRPADFSDSPAERPMSAEEQFDLGIAHHGQDIDGNSIAVSKLADGGACVQVAVGANKVTSCGDRGAYDRGDVLVAYQPTEGSPTIVAGAAPKGLTAVDVEGRQSALGDGTWAIELPGPVDRVTTTIGSYRQTRSIRSR
jgi:hypothetical protein